MIFIYIISKSSWLSELINYDYSPKCFVIIGWISLWSSLHPKTNVTIILTSSLGDCIIELLIQLHTGSLSNTHFSAQWFFFAFSPLFLAELIAFLYFYQKTSISKMYLNLLWLPQHHCVSSLNHRTECCSCWLKVGGFGCNTMSFNMMHSNDYSTEYWIHKLMWDYYSSTTALHLIQ